MELLPLPGVGLVVVALGALDLHAQEDPRDLARHLDRLGLVRQREVDRPVLVVATGGGDQVRRHLVPRPVRGELLGEPRLERRIADLVPVLVRRVVEDHVAPVARPVGGIIRALQQVRRSARHACPCPCSRTNARTCSGVGSLPVTSRETRRDELLVGRQRGGGRLGGRQPLLQHGVDRGGVERRRRDRLRGAGGDRGGGLATSSAPSFTSLRTAACSCLRALMTSLALSSGASARADSPRAGTSTRVAATRPSHRPASSRYLRHTRTVLSDSDRSQLCSASTRTGRTPQAHPQY